MFYRLRRAANYSRFRFRTRRIRSTLPIACRRDADCEIHTMLSETDVPLYLVAIKSFLRFHRSVSVVVHSDGTLGRGSHALIRWHVPGCRVISAFEADDRARSVLGEGSPLHRWRSLDASYRRIIDTEVWCGSHRRIIMDADVLIMDEPSEVIEWAERGVTPFLIGQPPDHEPPAPGSFAERYVGTIFKNQVGALGEMLGETPRYLDGTTSGFYGCTDELGLERVGSLLGAAVRLGIPMTEWGGEQSTVLYLLSTAGASRLDPERYFNFFADEAHKVGGAKMIHFIGTDRFFKNVYINCANRVIEDLGRKLRSVAV
jgi:hypothetical protein